MLRIAVAPFEQQVELAPSVIRTAKQRARDFSRGQREIVIDQMKAKKKVEHYPQFGVLVDLDAYVEDPPYPDDLSVSDFIASAFGDFTEAKRIVLAKA